MSLALTVALFTCKVCNGLWFRSHLSPERCPHCGSDAIERQGR